MNIQSQKFPAVSITIGIMTLAVVLLAISSSGAPTTPKKEIGHWIEALDPLQHPGGIGSEKDLAQGRFLVASRKLKDPNFHKTVVLLLRYGQDGASGLVINRPLTVKLSTLLPEIKDSKHRDKHLYLGGPVEPNKIVLLVKSATPPPESLPVFRDVYVSSSHEDLQRLINSTSKDDKFKIFAGYAGWAPRQLEAERERGDWHVFKADAETVFDKKFSEIWQELIHRLKTNWVRLKPKDGSVIQKFNHS
jgi:putative transcriptional regulator